MTGPTPNQRLELARQIQKLVDRRIHTWRRNEEQTFRWATVFGNADTVKRTVSLLLNGLSTPSPGFVYLTALPPNPGDHVLAVVDPLGDRYVLAVAGRDMGQEIIDTVTPPIVQPDRARTGTARILTPPEDIPPDVVIDVCNAVMETGVRTGVTTTSVLTDTGDVWYYEIFQSSHSPGARLDLIALTSATIARIFTFWQDAVPSVYTPDEIGMGLGSPPLPLRTGTFVVPASTGSASAIEARIGADYLGPGVTVNECMHIEMWRGGPPPVNDDHYVPAPEVVDGDDLTQHVATFAEAVRIDLGAAYRVVRARIVMSFEDAGAKTYELRGANEGDYSDEVTVATLSFTATGSFTSTTTLTPVWPSTTPYRFWRLVGPEEVRRVHTVELYEQTAGETPVTNPTTGEGAPIDEVLAEILAAIITDHGALDGLDDDDHPQYTTGAEATAIAGAAASSAVGAHTGDAEDAHDASAVSFDPTASGLAATDVQAAIDEVVGTAGAQELDDLDDVAITAPAENDTLRYVDGVFVNDSRQFRPVTHDFGSGPELVWDGDDLVMEWF